MPGIDVQNSEQRIDLCLRLLLRVLQLARELHPRAHVGHRHQHVGDLAVDAHAVEFEVQVASVELAPAHGEVHFDFAQRIDGLHQLLVGALRPEHFHELQRGGQRLLRDDALQQVLEPQAGQILSLEQRSRARSSTPCR